MDMVGCEFRLPFTSRLSIVHWKSKALQERLSIKTIYMFHCYRIMLQKVSYSLKQNVK